MPETDLMRIEQLEAVLGPDETSDLLRLFFAEAPGRLMAIAQACAERRRGQVAAGAHSLRGAAAMFGAESAARMCAQVEALADQGALDAAQALIGRVHAQLEAFRRAVRIALPLAAA